MEFKYARKHVGKAIFERLINIVKDTAEFFANLRRKSGTVGRQLIKGVTFEDSFNFVGHGDFKFEFQNCKFLSNVKFENGKLESEMIFKDCEFKAIIFRNCECKSAISFLDVSISSDLHFSGGTYASIILNPIHVFQINIHSGTFGAFMIYSPPIEIAADDSPQRIIESVSMEGYADLEGIFRIGNEVIILNLNIRGNLEKVDLTLTKLPINNFRMDNVTANEKIKISHLRRPTESDNCVMITNSYLGKMQFFSVDFSVYQDVRIIDSHITDCYFVGVTWMHSVNQRAIALKQFKEETADQRQQQQKRRTDMYQRTRETCRQLKYACEKQGDFINGQKFHILEMKAYDQSLSWESDFWTKLVIKFSSWFSNFGQSLRKPITALLIGNAVFTFLFLYYALNHTHQWTSDLSKADIGYSIGRYISLLNPVHAFEPGLPAMCIFLDTLMRIWSSYMIYNIVRASRRFIK